MRTAERCMCGATDCWSCGPAQGYRVGGPSDDEVAERAAEIAIDRLYNDPDEFHEVMEGVGSRDIYKPLQRALKMLSEKKQWNNDGWMHSAINSLQEVAKILEAQQDTSRFEDEALNQLLEEE